MDETDWKQHIAESDSSVRMLSMVMLWCVLFIATILVWVIA